MLKSKLLAIYGLIPLAFLSYFAHAEFIETDLLIQADALSTVDTDFGLDWPDFSDSYHYYAHGMYDNHAYACVFLVNDGGLSLDSISNPELNASNLNSPYNSASVPLTSSIALLSLGLAGLN